MNIGVGVTIMVHLLGLLHCLHVLIYVRSSQGAIAWMLAFLVMPWIAIPFLLGDWKN